jgi:hypothetical protein
MPNYVMGLDIGQHVDHAALAIVERLLRVPVVDHTMKPEYTDIYRIVHLREWRLNTSPQDVLDDLAEMIHSARGELEWAAIAYDATGIGASWTEVIYRRYRARDLTRFEPRGYIITGTETPSKDPSVRKIDLMSKIQVTANQGRLELDPDLHLADRFAVQLQAINATPTASGRLSFAAPQAIHDDLVTAVSLGLHSRVSNGQVKPRHYIIGQPAPPALNPLDPDMGPAEELPVEADDPSAVLGPYGERLGLE